MSTPKHLLVLSLGPVQGFIAAARKTRDLWFGSHLLSEVAKAAAMSIHKSGGTLIFPGIKNVDEIKAGSNLSVANVILAEVSGEPKTIAEKAKTAAEKRWKEFSEKAKKEVEKIAGRDSVLRTDLWEQQINDFLEFQAAWCPLNSENYTESRKRVMQLLAGRKACRDFSPGHGQAGVPKSSLDGARETVLGDWKESKLKYVFEKFVERLYLRENEQLDAIGVVKRFADDFEDRTKFQSLQDFAASPVLRNPKTSGCPLEKAAEKSPYLAILLADGDKMGKAISEQKSAVDHQKLSIALSGFAQGVEAIVKDHHGECVYVGGDDVLAFLPLDTAVDCARQLHDDFARKLEDYQGVSLSVGIVVGHYHEMLENLLEFARIAEKMAKKPNEGKDKDAAPFGDRNGLAISCYSRGNAPISIREQWQTGEESLDKRLDKWVSLFAKDRISMKFPYDLRELVRLYEGFDNKCDLPPKAIRKGALQVAKQKRIKAEYLQDRLKTIDSIASLRRLADEMMIAQTIGSAVQLRDKNADGLQGTLI